MVSPCCSSVVGTMVDDQGPSMPSTVILHSTKPQDWNAVAGTFVKEPEVVQFEGLSYTRSKSTLNSVGFFTPDNRTIVIGQEDGLKQ